MRIVTAAVVALAGSPAAADTAMTTDAACEVRFVRAPDEVRHVIETWLAAEPRCTSTIELRVIPTEQGFYLIAQRPDGRIHERFVPDAQSAGVLVASWVADDWVAPQSNVWSSPRPAAAPLAPVLTPPQNTSPTAVPSVTAVSAPRAPSDRAPRWISAGALLSTTDSADGGLRLEVDVLTRGNVTLGAAITWTETSMGVSTGSGSGEMRSSDFAATSYAAYTLHAGRWELRTALGLGAVYSEVNGLIETSPGQPWSDMPYFNSSGGGFVGTASMVLSARVSDNWGIHGGALAHAISERFPTDSGLDLQRKDSHLFFFTGLRRRI